MLCAEGRRAPGPLRASAEREEPERGRSDVPAGMDPATLRLGPALSGELNGIKGPEVHPLRGNVCTLVSTS